VRFVRHRPGYATIWTEERIRRDLRKYPKGKKQWPSRLPACMRFLLASTTVCVSGTRRAPAHLIGHDRLARQGSASGPARSSHQPGTVTESKFEAGEVYDPWSQPATKS
jgi:hypothetical protein